MPEPHREESSEGSRKESSEESSEEGSEESSEQGGNGQFQTPEKAVYDNLKCTHSILRAVSPACSLFFNSLREFHRPPKASNQHRHIIRDVRITVQYTMATALERKVYFSGRDPGKTPSPWSLYKLLKTLDNAGKRGKPLDRPTSLVMPCF